MNKMKQLAFSVAIVLPLTAANVQAADEAPKARSGEEIAKTCAACHGADGNAVIPTYPSLAGQYANYLVKALEDYKAGKRTGGQAAVMVGQAAALSEAEMEAVAKYYAKMEGKLAAAPAN